MSLLVLIDPCVKGFLRLVPIRLIVCSSRDIERGRIVDGTGNP
jgi:hypothetical protein